MSKKLSDLSENSENLQSERKALNEKIDSLREENQNSSNDLMKLKLEFGMQEALMKQQIEFQKK